MQLVIACWVLAMVSAFSWARWYTALFTAATLLVFMWTRGSVLASPAGWFQAAILGATPWLLAAQRDRQGTALKRMREEESARVTRLSETARSLLSLQQATQEMERQIGEITDLYHVTKETSRALHLDELFAASLTIAPRFLDARGLRLIDLSGEAPRVFRASRAADGRFVASPNGGGEPSSEGRGLLDMEQAIIKRVMAQGGSSSGSAQELSCPLPAGVSRVSWAPLMQEQQPIGILAADELPANQLKTLAITANQLALQCSRIHLYRQVEALAVTDALTGVFVRRHFMERARGELARSKRHGLSCTLLMVDLDWFKQKNDTYGHLVGDVVLKDVARLLSRNLREVDMIARYGGEEFVLLLVETGSEQAMPIAQRLKQLVEVHPIRAYDELLTQTISIGVAAFPDHAQTLEALIERADQALYAAKRAGRNRVLLWSQHFESTTQVGSGFGAEGSGQLPTAHSPEP